MTRLAGILSLPGGRGPALPRRRADCSAGAPMPAGVRARRATADRAKRTTSAPSPTGRGDPAGRTRAHVSGQRRRPGRTVSGRTGSRVGRRPRPATVAGPPADRSSDGRPPTADRRPPTDPPTFRDSGRRRPPAEVRNPLSCSGVGACLPVRCWAWDDLGTSLALALLGALCLAALGGADGGGARLQLLGLRQPGGSRGIPAARRPLQPRRRQRRDRLRGPAVPVLVDAGRCWRGEGGPGRDHEPRT